MEVEFRASFKQDTSSPNRAFSYPTATTDKDLWLAYVQEKASQICRECPVFTDCFPKAPQVDTLYDRIEITGRRLGTEVCGVTAGEIVIYK